MKKIITLIFLLIGIICSPYNVNASEDDTNVVIFLEAKQEEELIIVSAELVENEGIFALTLELDYDKNVFDFISCDFKDALNKLEPIMTNNPQNSNPIIINWMSSDGANDYSKGDLLVLTFKLKNPLQIGDYQFDLKCDKGNLLVLEDNEIVEKDIVIRSANLSLNDKINDAKPSSDYTILIILGSILFVILITLIVFFLKKYWKVRQKANE